MKGGVDTPMFCQANSGWDLDNDVNWSQPQQSCMRLPLRNVVRFSFEGM